MRLTVFRIYDSVDNANGVPWVLRVNGTRPSVRWEFGVQFFLDNRLSRYKSHTWDSEGHRSYCSETGPHQQFDDGRFAADQLRHRRRLETKLIGGFTANQSWARKLPGLLGSHQFVQQSGHYRGLNRFERHPRGSPVLLLDLNPTGGRLSTPARNVVVRDLDRTLTTHRGPP